MNRLEVHQRGTIRVNGMALVVFMDHGKVLEERASEQFFTHLWHERWQAFLSKIL